MERVFKWLTFEGQDSKAGAYTNWFAKSFEPDNFTGVDKLLMCYLQYCAKLSITPKREFLNAYLKVDGKRDIKEYNIKTDTMSSYDYREASQLEAAYQVLRDQANATYDQYVSVDLDGRDFKVDLYEFMSSKKSDSIQDVMMQAYPRLTDGSDITEVSSDIRSKLSKLDEVYDEKKIKKIDVASSGKDSSDDEMHFICKTNMPCVDGDIGGFYTRLIYTINAQPAGGKTRFALIHFVYPTLVEAKKDVVYYSTELMAMQVKNILIAHHITKLYGGRVKIPDTIMNRKSEMSPEQLQIYESAKIDLFESGKYGSFVVEDECVVETLYDDLMNYTKTCRDLGLIVIDYMGLCKSKPESKWDKHLDQYEIITKGYESVRDVLKAVDIGAVCINQYNDKGIEAAFAGKPIRSGHVQGGHIVQRHTDYDISITYTEEQKLANVRVFQTSKTRGTPGFSNVLVSVDLSVSIFRQELSRQA